MKQFVLYCLQQIAALSGMCIAQITNLFLGELFFALCAMALNLPLDTIYLIIYYYSELLFLPGL